MYFKNVAYVKASTLEPGSICALVLHARLIYGLIGTSEDDYQNVSKLFVALRHADADAFGGGSFVHVGQMTGICLFHVAGAYFVPEMSEQSLLSSPDTSRHLGLKESDTYFCVQGNPFLHTFNTKTGADSNKPIRDMAVALRWKVEAEGTDGRPVTVCEC